MIEAVVFDLDDTLYPEEAFVFSGYRAVSDAVEAARGFAIHDALVARFRGGERGDLFTPALGEHLDEVTESYVQGLVRVYREHAPDIAPFPDTEAVLRELGARWPLGLISDGIAEVQQRKLDALGLADHFAEVVLSGAYGRDNWKPAALPYELCAKHLALPAAALVYVGDNPAKDFVTARRLGMKTIRVRRPGTLHHRAEAAPGYEADVTVESLTAVPGVLISF